MFIVLVINALMGATFSIVKFVLENYTSPIFLVGYRMTLAGTILLGYLYLFKRESFKLHKQDWLSFVKIILFHVYISYIAEFLAVDYLSPAKVALLFNLSPFITATLSYVMHKQTQSMKKLLGLMIGFVGFAPILMEQTSVESSVGGLGFFSWPELSVFVAVASAAYAWLIVESLVVRRKYSTLMVNGFGMFFGGLMATATSWVIGNYGSTFGIVGLERAWNPWPFTDFSYLTFYVLILIVLSNIIFYNTYAWLMHRYSATFMSFSGLTIPLFAALWEWIIFKDVPSWGFWLSLMIVSLGLTLYYKEEMKEA